MHVLANMISAVVSFNHFEETVLIVIISDPDFYPSWIPDPGSWIPDPRISDLGSRKKQQKRGAKTNSCHTFFGATNFTKFKIILFLK
jgi:hypothetical protein